MLLLFYCIGNCRYEKKLGDAHTLGLKKGMSVGVSTGAIYFVFFVCYAAAFW